MKRFFFLPFCFCLLALLFVSWSYKISSGETRHGEMSAQRNEIDIITAVIDLAASRREPINAYGDYDEWLTFESICTALDDVGKKLKIGKHVEQSCYQALLRMSAESEQHLTWWEKIEQIEKYLHPASSTKTKIVLKHALPTPSYNLIRLVEPERGIHVDRRTVSTMSPSTQLENENLSMLLNGTSGLFRSGQSYDYTSQRTTTSTRKEVLNRSAASVTHNGGTNSINDPARRHIHFNDQPEVKNYQLWQSVNDKLSDIQHESHQVKGDIASMLSRSSMKATARESQSTPPSRHPRAAADDSTPGDWTLSPSVIHTGDSSTIQMDTPYTDAMGGAVAVDPAPVLAPPSLQPPLPPPSNDERGVDATSNRKTRSRAYSELLRQSGVMSKYLGIGGARGGSMQAGGSQRSPTIQARARSESPPRSASKTHTVKPATHSVYETSHVPLSVRSPAPAAPPGKKQMPLFDSPPHPTPAPRHHHHHLHHGDTGSPSDFVRRSGSNDGSNSPSAPPRTPAARSGIAPYVPYTYTPGRVVPLVLQGLHGKGGMYTPEGHIHVEALDFDAHCLPSEGFLTGAGAADGGEVGQIPVDEQLVNTITSTTRVLILFHRWILQRSDHKNIHFGDARNAALMLAAHFSELGGFVSSLFGLEQWLRDKMRLIAVTEAKAYVFRTWNLKYGVSAQSRMFWRRKRLHLGFESFLEYGMKRRMHRKNGLHALAARRRHANVSHMAPVLRHRPPRPASSAGAGASGLEDTQDEEDTDTADRTHSTLSLRGLGGLSKYSSLDMTMLNTSQQQQLQRQAAKRAQYLTSLSIRDIIHDAKTALLSYSRGGNNADGFRVKTQEYVQAQDTVALLFAFRRLYHRSIYITRQRRVRASVRRGRMVEAMALWKQSWTARASVERAMEPQVVRVLEEMKAVKVRIALRKLSVHVYTSRQEKAALRRYGERIRSKAIYLRAFHSMRCAAFVKCFNTLKQNYIAFSPTVAEQRRSDRHHLDYSQHVALHRWRQWYQRHSTSRRNGIRGEVGRRALMGLLLHRTQIWHIVQPGRHSSGTCMSTDTFLALPAVRQMHMSREIVGQCVQLLQLRRALHRLRCVGRCTRVFFSMTELRFAQALCRHSLPSERRQYMRLVNDSSCRILPSAKQTALASKVRPRDATFRNPHSGGSSGSSGFDAIVGRSSAEKPYKLIGIHPDSLRYHMCTLFNSAPLELRENSNAGGGGSIRKSAEFIAPFLHKPIVTLDGGVLSNTPQLLRTLRKWIRLCRERGHLRKLADRVRRRHSLVVLREMYDQWAQAYQWERECNRCNKHLAMHKFRALVSRGRVVRRANSRTRRGVTHRHWARFAAAHVHQTELRRLHGGHFFNSVMNGASSKVLSFVANHHFVPFSVRHFLSHFPSYRFPVYKRYEAAYWEHSSQSAAYQALQVLCRHYEVYGHEHHLAHHLELFQHHHQEEFGPGEFTRATAATSVDPQRRQNAASDLFPHSCASPALRVVAENSSRRSGLNFNSSSSSNKPLHLVPGAMLSDQPFSVRAAISNHYRRSAAEDGPHSGGRSGSFSPQKSRGSRPRDEFSTPAASTSRLSIRFPVTTYNSSTEPPAAVQLAGAAVFMAHWISECLRQYYALRRGLLLLRKHARCRTRRASLLRQSFFTKAKVAFVTLWQNRRDHVLMKQLQRRCLRMYSRKMRVASVSTKYRRGLMRLLLQRMNRVYRYRLILRTWESAWRIKMQSAWSKLCAFTDRRETLVSRVKLALHRRIQLDTIRVMCTVSTANMWRRRRSRVAGLSAFVVHYNRGVQAMDRADLVRTYATTKHYTVLRKNLLGLLKQRLCSIIGMAYRKKSALIRGFLAIAGNVREPQRQISEGTLRDRLHHNIFALRRNHASYKEHSFRAYDCGQEEGLVINTFNSFRERQLLKACSRYQHEFSRRGVHSPYVSDTLPLPSPVPPAHTLDTPVRHASMLRAPDTAAPARISHDALSEAAPEPARLSTDSRGRSLLGPAVVGDSLSGPSSVPRAHRSSAALLFGSVRNSVSHSQLLDSRSARGGGGAEDIALGVRASLHVRTRQSSAPATVGEQPSTLSAMSARRRSLRQQEEGASDNDSLNSADLELESMQSSFVSRGAARSSSLLASPRPASSPYLPRGRRASTGTAARAQQGVGGGGDRSVADLLGMRRMSALGMSVASMSSSRSMRPLSRRSSLHDVHEDMLSAPTSEPAASALAASSGTPFPSRQSVPRGGGGPASILITSPAYNPSQRPMSRGDSRIFFHDSVHDLGAAGPTPRRSADGRTRASAGDLQVNLLQPFSPLTQHTEDDAPRGPGGFFFDDASTEVSTLRETVDGSRSGYSRVQRRKSFIHAMRNEETVEQMQVLTRAMQRGLWLKWRRELLFRKDMQQFCTQYLFRRMLRTSLQVIRHQTSLDRYQRLQLHHIDKRRAFALLSAHAVREDERRQVVDFAEKYYVVMAMKLTLRRWRARANKSAATTGRYARAAAFSSKRRCTLFLLSLRASCLTLAAVEASTIASSERPAGMHSKAKSAGNKSRTRKSSVPPPRRRASWGNSDQGRDSEEDQQSFQGRDSSGRGAAAATLTPGAINALLTNRAHR